VKFRFIFAAVFCAPACLFVLGCHSYRIDVVVENHTGGAIELLEVDYPSASFGADKLDSGAEYRYRITVRDSGPVKVQYTETASQKVRQMIGPTLVEHQEGRLEIVLLPEGKAEFYPQVALHR
jgi:hypothetical protein